MTTDPRSTDLLLRLMWFIKTNPQYKDVYLYLREGGSGHIGCDNGGEDYIMHKFTTIETCMHILEDLSNFTLDQWCERYAIEGIFKEGFLERLLKEYKITNPDDTEDFVRNCLKPRDWTRVWSLYLCGN